VRLPPTPYRVCFRPRVFNNSLTSESHCGVRFLHAVTCFHREIRATHDATHSTATCSEDRILGSATKAILGGSWLCATLCAATRITELTDSPLGVPHNYLTNKAQQ